MATSAAKEYNAGQIQVLKGLEAVRKRPGMYIGSTGPRGLHHLVYEVVDNSIDEALAGLRRPRGRHHPRGRLDHRDRQRPRHPRGPPPHGGGPGRGAGAHGPARRREVRQRGRGLLQGLRRPARRGRLGGERALRVAAGGGEARREGLRDRASSAAPRRGTCEVIGHGAADETGTTVSFKPDPEIFPERSYSFDTLATRLRELAFLNKGVLLTLTRRAEGRTRRRASRRREEYHYEGGHQELRGVPPRAPASRCTRSRSTSRRRAPEAEIEVALQYDDGYNENTFTFVNNINTHEGGTHLTGFKSALTRTINDYARKAGLFKKGGLDGALGRRRARGADLRALGEGQASRSSRGRRRPSWATAR